MSLLAGVTSAMPLDYTLKRSPTYIGYQDGCMRIGRSSNLSAVLYIRFHIYSNHQGPNVNRALTQNIFATFHTGFQINANLRVVRLRTGTYLLHRHFPRRILNV